MHHVSSSPPQHQSHPGPWWYFDLSLQWLCCWGRRAHRSMPYLPLCCPPFSLLLVIYQMTTSGKLAICNHHLCYLLYWKHNFSKPYLKLLEKTVVKFSPSHGRLIHRTPCFKVETNWKCPLYVYYFFNFFLPLRSTERFTFYISRHIVSLQVLNDHLKIVYTIWPVQKYDQWILELFIHVQPT